MGRFHRSWELWRECLSVLRKDKELLLFPVMSFIGLVAVGVALLLPTAWFVITQLSQSTSGWELEFWDYVLLFLWYFLSYGVVYFFNAGLVGCALMRLEGKDPTVRDGLRIASENLSRILGWALVAAMVGLLLRLLENLKIGGKRGRGGLEIGKLISWILGLSWALLTYLVVPVLIVERVGPIEAVKRSGVLFKRTWGEQVIGEVGLGLIVFLLALPGFVPIIGGALFGAASGSLMALSIALAIGGGLTLLYWLGLGALASALGGIYTAALYRYATTQQIPEGFRREGIVEAFKPQLG